MKNDDFFNAALKEKLFNKDKIFNNILEKIKIDKLEANLDILLLTSINKGDTYGTRLIKDLAFTLKNSLKNCEGIIYPELHNLENKKLINSYWVIGDINRKYYSITKLGKNYLKEKQAVKEHLYSSETAILKEEFSWT